MAIISSIEIASGEDDNKIPLGTDDESEGNEAAPPTEEYVWSGSSSDIEVTFWSRRTGHEMERDRVRKLKQGFMPVHPFPPSGGSPARYREPN